MDNVELEILDLINDPVVIIDAKRTLRFINKAAKLIFPGKSIDDDLVAAIRDPGALKAVDQILKDREVEVRGRLTLSAPVEQHFDFKVSLLPESLGELGKAIMLLHDITRVLDAEEFRSAFIGDLSHELRSPLSSLTGFIETLQGPAKEDDNARAHFLQLMENEAHRMKNLIDDLLSLSQLEAEEHIRPSQKVDLVTLASSVILVGKQKALKRNMEIRLNTENVVPSVLGDSDELRRVIRNLVDNAISYGEESSIIEVSINPIDLVYPAHVHGVALSVHNKGTGIEQTDIPRLTERFYRTDKARSRETGGTGLGLAIVKHAINRHRGDLKIESDEVKGTTFTFSIPAFTE